MGTLPENRYLCGINDNDMTPIEFRRHLHAHPELSFAEHATAAFIEDCLKAEGIACRRIADTGVIAEIAGRNAADGRTVVLRADIDALPIHEATGLAFASCNEGVMHACGHDIHAAVLFGVLQELNRSRDFDGTILGVFQPAEECNPGGASKVLAERPFEGRDIIAVIGEHVDSGLEVGEIGFCAGRFMASNDELRFRVRGRGGHAAQRDRIDDTVTAAAHIVTMLNAVNDGQTVLSIGRITADGATNVIPDEVYMEGTLRTFDESVRRTTWRIIESVAATVDARFGTRTETDIDRGYPCVVNDEGLTAFAKKIAEENCKATTLPPRTTSEDFGWYCTEYPSLFYRLGAGSAAGRSHTPTFSPDERAIGVGIDFMRRLAVKTITEYGKKEK